MTLRIIMVIVSFFVVGVASGQNQNADSFKEVQDLLEKTGIDYDHAAARDAATLAMVKSVDRLADIVGEEDHKRLVKRFAGTWYDSGMRLTHTNGRFRVSYMDPGSPAVRGGVRVRSDILEVDGEDVASVRIGRVIELLRSAEPARRMIKLLDESDEVYEVELILDAMPVGTVEMKTVFPRDLCYLKLNGLYKDSGKELVRIIRRWSDAGKSGLILDLRDANGKDLDSVRAVAGLFTPESELLFEVSNQVGDEKKEFRSGNEEPASLPTMVLVNERTRGAAELLAATLQAAGRGAMVLGEETPGDFALREFMPLSDGDYLYITSRKVTLLNERELDGKSGIIPDVVLADADIDSPARGARFRSARPGTREEDAIDEALQVRAQNDAILQRAVDVLLGLKALNLHALGTNE